MNLRQLEHFVALAETGSFSRAALRLHVTQPALSRSIQQLEAELGGALVDRVGKRNELTPLGGEVLSRARLIGFQASELKRAGELLASGGIGEIRIGFGAGPGAVLTVPFMRMMAATHPRTRVVVSRGAVEAQLRALRAREIDGLLIDIRSVVPASDLRIEHVADLRGAFLCRRGHPLARLKEVRFADVLRFPIASSPISAEVRRLLVHRYGPHADPELCTTIVCEDVAPLIETTLTTDAVFLGTAAAGRDGLASGDLVELALTPALSASGTFGFVTLAGRTEAPAMSLLREFAREHLRDA
ncbi:LysR family transcriptional regulator [Ramlibacter sp. Leaf400]|uniref:LysR family transcriptional regulator n=1 Tax=Ramlibacter sp. Leaf400 TaxID=1736365 RepID=UPI0006F2C2B7|nr:LysR family transcriptional regulator [Ramlibacter sp. Leaf400]KQT09436.1 LysR family transcriptional regulator [Ramlibacter sp. Leaf400]